MQAPVQRCQKTISTFLSQNQFLAVAENFANGLIHHVLGQGLASLKHQTPCFFLSGEFPRIGRSVISSPLVLTSNESPGSSCSSSRSGLGRTIRPALSMVSLLVIMEYSMPCHLSVQNGIYFFNEAFAPLLRGGVAKRNFEVHKRFVRGSNGDIGHVEA
jgi:hypothetical protein